MVPVAYVSSFIMINDEIIVNKPLRRPAHFHRAAALFRRVERDKDADTPITQVRGTPLRHASQHGACPEGHRHKAKTGGRCASDGHAGVEPTAAAVSHDQHESDFPRASDEREGSWEYYQEKTWKGDRWGRVRWNSAITIFR